MGDEVRLYINRSVVDGPWGGGNGAVRALLQHMPSDVTLATASPLDVVLCMGIDPEDGHPGLEQLVDMKKRGARFKLILRVNTCDARRGNPKGVVEDARILAASLYVDGTIFVSNWMRDYFFELGYPQENTTVIYNGVDHEAFKPDPEKQRSAKVRIVTAHWSDNAMKGQDYYEWLDDFVGQWPQYFEYTFIGRTKAQFKHSKHIAPLHGRALGEELSKHDICVNASRWDPGPNSVTESIACGLPTLVHEDGGGGVEFAGHSDEHTFATFDELEATLWSQWKLQNGSVVDEIDVNPNEQLWQTRTWQHFADDMFTFMRGTK